MNMSELVINPWTINIFSDASTKTAYRGSPTDACYGAIAYCEFDKVDEWYRIIHDTTSNHAEIKGINLAVRLAIYLRDIYPVSRFNIFSDSQISVYGMRDRYGNRYLADNHIYSSSNDNSLISSQEVYVETMQMIADYQLPVSLWNQKAHVAMSHSKSLEHAKNSFCTCNRPKAVVDDDFIYYISEKNNEVDKTSRCILKHTNVGSMNYEEPLYFIPNDYTNLVYRYKKTLIKKGE